MSALYASSFHSALAVLSLLPLLAIGSGCAALAPSGDLAAVAAPEALGGDPAGVAGAAPVSVEIRAAGKAPEFQKLGLQNGMHVQEALEQTKLTRRFRRMDVRIMRPTGGHMAKLDIKYNYQTGRVDPLFDYALHPGDHLIVTEDTTTVLDDMMRGLPLPGTPRGR